jgi:molybdopterin-guanine dinucleotide biosynthesis protein
VTILWIGGATDAGKTTLARALAARFGCELYEYDRTDAAHHEALAAQHHDVRAFMLASMDARWVTPTPEQLFRRAMRSFRLRWPLLLRELGELTARPGATVIIEGFGLLPDLVRPLMDDARQGLWLAPSEAFRRGSWLRRDKPGFRAQVSDPDRAAANLWGRDLLLAAEIERQAHALQLKLIINDGAMFADELVDAAADWFAPFLPVQIPR